MNVKRKVGRQETKLEGKDKESKSTEMQTIIDRWGNDPQPDNYIFPVLKGGETPKQIKEKNRDLISATNRRLKDIGEKLNLGAFSTYTARHSYATVLKRSGANIAFISESLGHNDLKTTENYLASFEKEERKKNAKKLTAFPKDPKPQPRNKKNKNHGK